MLSALASWINDSKQHNTLSYHEGLKKNSFNGVQTKSEQVISSYKEFLCVTRTVKHNYILLISTVRIQLHVSALNVDHLQVEIFNLQISYTRCVRRLGGRGARSRCFNSGYHDPELLEVHKQN